MKKIILLALTVALGSMHLWGQTTPPAGTLFMEFSVARQTTFKFKLQGHFKNTDVWVSTSPGNYTHQTISDVWADYQTVSAGRFPTTVKIYGAIKAIDAGVKTTNEDNKLSLIDVTKNPSLKALSCYGAGIRTLNISKNSELTVLECSNNLLTNLDVSKHSKLERLNCANNQLVLLNVANGNNRKFITFDASGNSGLTCIQVDDGFTPSANWKKDATAQWNNDSANPCPNNYQIRFKTNKAVGGKIKLQINAKDEDRNEIWIDLNNNGVKDGDEAITSFSESTFTQYTFTNQNIVIYGKVNYLNCENNEVSSLDISENNNLINLHCGNNLLSSLDISKNTNLSKLRCLENQLTYLDVSKNINLTVLYCSSNQLSNIDISKNNSLTQLYCQANQLSNLDVSKNTNLTTLNCSENQLSSLDFSANNNLKILYCYKNQLSSLNMSQNSNLVWLYCEKNQLSSLNISKNVNLINLYCNENNLTNLDISKNAKLTSLKCQDNQIVNLNVANGNNPNVILFNATNNPLLSCIQVDDGFIPSETWLKDATTEWNNDSENPCFTNEKITFTTTKAVGERISLGVNAASTDQADIWIDLNNNGVKDAGEAITSFTANTLTRYTLGAQSITLYGKVNRFDCRSSNINSLDISKNTHLTSLICTRNQLTHLDVSKHTNLTTLDCSSNKLDVLDVSQNSNLAELECYSNKLINLDVSKNSDLTKLNCGANLLENLDVKQNINLALLNCPTNKLTDLDVSKNINLTSLSCFSNQLPNLDIKQNINLTLLSCAINKLTNLDISKNTNLTTLNCATNQLTNLDVSKNINLTILECHSNQLTNLDVSKNIDLTILYCKSNQLKSLILDQHSKLIILDCIDNELTSLNVANGNNANVTTFNATNNPNLTCIQVDDGFTPPDTWGKDATAQWNNDSTNPCDPSIGINDLVLNSVKIYPNPAKEILYITSDVKVKRVKIYNLQGQLVLEQEHSDVIPISHLTSGIYQVMIITDNGVYTEKMIKQ